VIAFEGGFHGRTLMSLTLTSKTHPYKAGLGPFAPEVYRMPFAQDYRGPSTTDALTALERGLLTTVAAENVAAIVIEPVQGEGGFVVAPPEFLEGVRRICDDNGIVLVIDEVQTGFGRTGRCGDRAYDRARPDHRSEVDRSGAAALRRDRTRGDHGCPGDSAIGGICRRP
jgi:4-aminobutyrate aminotransferase/(S)-3-amino-2-methylpropionate transaminase